MRLADLRSVVPTEAQILALRAEAASPTNNRFSVLEDGNICTFTDASSFLIRTPRWKWRCFDIQTPHGQAILQAHKRLRSARATLDHAVAKWQPVPQEALALETSAALELRALFEHLPLSSDGCDLERRLAHEAEALDSSAAMATATGQDGVADEDLRLASLLSEAIAALSGQSPS